MTRVPFEYALLRVVPRADRGECANVGVLLWCQARAALRVATHVDAARLRALDPGVDLDAVRAALAAISAVCAADPAAGPVAGDPPGVRFRGLVAPRSTVVRPGPVHTGMTGDVERDLARLLDRLVR